METMSSPNPSSIKKPGRKGGSSHRLFDTILILLLIAAFAFIGYTEWQRQQTATQLNLTSQKLEEFKKNPQKSGDEVAKAVLDKLRKHMNFLESPAPTVATIVAADDLKKQNHFYDVAKNGDNLIILLVGENRGRAVLFDPNANGGEGKILDVAPVDIQAASPTPSGSAAPNTSPTPSGSPVASPAAGAPTVSTNPAPAQ